MSIEHVTPAAMASASEREMAEWNAQTADALEVEGYSLYGGKENDKTLDALIGVPFLIKQVTFRSGDIVPEGQVEPRDYVSVECLIRPDHALKFARRYVVFNDGSTGIYRQIVAALIAADLVDEYANLPESGDANTTRYDVSYSGEDGEPHSFNLRLLCPEGLRKSDYQTGKYGQAVTWYLA
jgi:hypothetical protein